MKNGKMPEGWDEELHVHISADSLDKVDKAVALIEPLLTPLDVSFSPYSSGQACDGLLIKLCRSACFQFCSFRCPVAL
jgi:hypothetical protein